ncbi:MAG: DUF2322 family protein [Thiobacillus sp.]|nr:DUF2322 family protein [Thiobacillus sp.]
MSFADTLKALPEANGTRLRLTDAKGAEVAVIENGPGTASSFRVYAYLAAKHGGITPAAAAEGLTIFAEHTDDARNHAGKHPNIDRLIELQASGATLAATVE